MFKTLRLLAPALFPSWRFFDSITASPRIEFLPLGPAGEALDAAPQDWREFRPRPQRLAPATYLRRLLWNPRWNDALYMTSCAERLLEQETAHSIAQIAARIAATLDPERTPSFVFRLTLVSRDGGGLHKEIAYVSPRQKTLRRQGPGRTKSATPLDGGRAG